MQNEFAGYGNQEPVDINEWRSPKNGVSMDWIEARVMHLLENFILVDTIYMSEDVHIEFMKSMFVMQRHSVGNTAPSYPQLASIVTSGGSLTIKMVPGFTDFCHIGTNATYNDLVRVQVDEAFENIFLRDCERE